MGASFAIDPPPKPVRNFAVKLHLLILGIATLATSAPHIATAVEITSPPSDLGPRMRLQTSGLGLKLSWQAARDVWLEIGLEPQNSHLISHISSNTRLAALAAELAPVFSVTTGTRVAPPGRPPEMSIWNTFFDNPGKRPHETHQSTFSPTTVRFEHARDSRLSIIFDGLTIGPFSGELWITAFAGTPLLQVEAVVSTNQDRVAYVYEAGLRIRGSANSTFSHMDTEGGWLPVQATAISHRQEVAVRHRVVFHSAPGGTVALFPPPHQFFFPVDITTNNRTAWIAPDGFGVRQDPKGGGNWVPWVNAPPNTKQRLSFFLLPHDADAKAAMADVLRYTRNDSFTELPGHTTFTSHYHMAIAVAAMERAKKAEPQLTPDFVKMFKDMGVRIVHLGEFHGDGHPHDPGPLRLPEMKAMFDECRRLSDDRLLMLPGEEANEHLGLRQLKRHPGHWMCLFPRPVYWTMVRSEGQPFAEVLAGYGKVYHVGNKDDMMRLLEAERGLAWTAHARIKASSWTPDIFRHEDFYKSDRWLGAAFKAMPADLSRDKLGERCLDLLNDMANWGDRKCLPGEVDVFKLDHTHELYGHMNINYLRLPKAPRYEEGWQQVLDVLGSGAFFTTTGEVLICDFKVNGKASGESSRLGDAASLEIVAELDWTFPLHFAEVISGDGERVYRDRIDLTDTGAFGHRELRLQHPLAKRKWVRLEVWDCARNGAYTQPVWLD
jgi:hypothetical protein